MLWFASLCSVSLVVKVSASLTNVGSLAVGAFDLVNCSLSVVVRLVPVLVSRDCNIVVDLWAKQIMLLGCKIREVVSEVPFM